MDIRQAFEESLVELGIDNLDDNLDNIPDRTIEKTEEEQPEDGALDSEEVEQPGDDEETSESDDDVEDSDLPILEITENARLKLPDGTLVDAKKAVLMQADYTRKTQELADQRKQFEQRQAEFDKRSGEVEATYQQMRDWYDERSSNPPSWIAEIASSTQDPTTAMAQALYDMAKSGQLDPQFVEMFGIETGVVAEIAEKGAVMNEVTELKQWKQRQEEERQREILIRQQQAKYEAEWEGIKTVNGLNFQGKADEMDLKRELLQFAIDNNLSRSLVDAYDLMMVRKNRVPLQQVKAQPDPELVAKKRASRAVTPKSSVTGSTTKKKRNLSDREAILEAMEELTGA